MNTKKSKNKNRSNKAPNPSPPQKIDILTPQVKKVDEVKGEETADCVLKCDERVPEIVSEIIASPVVEAKDAESDTPKKPKRNRGKKKQSDKDDVNESEDGQIQETAIEEPKPIENLESLLSEITPAARKKKNKKKGNEKMVEPMLEQQEQKNESKNIPPDVNVINEAQQISTEIKEDFVQHTIETTEQEIKHSKKKNKKKKRHDSEKSDKAEEALACTAAFQKLLNVKDENVDFEKKNDVKSVIEDGNTETEIKISTLDILIPEKTLSEAVSTLPAMALEDHPLKSKEISQDDGKIKKRNKKEKKLPPKTESEKVEPVKIPDPKTEIIEPPAMVLNIDTASENVIKDEIIKMEQPILEGPLKQESPELKAKIAKPVEKKRKGKQEHCHDSCELDVITNEQLTLTEENLDIIQHKVEQKANKNDTKTLLTEGRSAKKRDMKSKSPELKIILDEKAIKQKITDTKETDKIKLIDMRSPDTSEKITEMSTGQIIIDTEAATILRSEEVKDLTPDIPEKIETDHENKRSTEAMDAMMPEKIDTTVEKSDVLFNLPPLNETELELTTCEIVPDVHYPRSTSHSLLDDNNNIVIQELIVVEGVNLDSPVFAPNSPLIQGSGETPFSTPEMISSGISVTEIDFNLPEAQDGKTDLKSKVMEVNQDMEELRLSIERSLAEFTALDKSEEVPERKFEQIESQQTMQPNKIETESEVKTSHVEEVKTELNKSAPSSADVQTKPEFKETDMKTDTVPVTEEHLIKPPSPSPESPIPICPARKEHKGKGKSKKKGKQEAVPVSTTTPSNLSTTDNKDSQKEIKKEEKTEQKTEQRTETTQEKGKQQCDNVQDGNNAAFSESLDFEPIDNFEDALTSSVDDVNKTFEIIANEVNQPEQRQHTPQQSLITPEINIIAPEDTDEKQQKVHPMSQPKNLLGHTDIPVQSNRTDYKKERNKTPNTEQANVKIKDSVEIETRKKSKESQTENKRKCQTLKEPFSQMINDNEEYVFKYSFRKVFLQSACHVCKKELAKVRVPCNFCNLIFYCSIKHKDEDWTNHQALCFAVSTIVHLKDEKYIYGDAKNTAGHDYRLIRMQMILSCEKVVKRRLVPWEQEALLYPRVCAAVGCREWRQSKLVDCDGCGQISFCLAIPEHFPKSHKRWCKSYSLYQKLVTYQQTKGRLEPKLPSKVMADKYVIPEKINQVLAALYEEKIDMNDIQYAAVTQLATAPLTAAYCHQIYRNAINSSSNGYCKKATFTIHVVNAELQFEADALNKWEIFFLHLRPDIKELKVVLIGADLNPSNLPLDLLGKIKLCDKCQSKRTVSFSFEDKITYFEYRCSDNYINPDLVCAFNPSIHRSSVYNGKDPWPSTINSILKLKSPFIITSYTMTEMTRDLLRIKECTPIPYNVVSEPKYNNFASVRPDRNFISDDEIPLLFKNYCFSIVCGV